MKAIILDNAGYQRSYLVQQKAKASGIDLIYLPPYSPNLNLIERLWRYFKKKVMKNKYYANYTSFENAVDTFFQTFNDRIADMKSLLNFKFGLLKQVSIINKSGTHTNNKQQPKMIAV